MADAGNSDLLVRLRNEYQQALIEGKSEAARAIIEESLACNLSVTSIYLDLICAAQRELGELWQAKKVSVTQEHIGTEISLLQISWLRMRAARKAPLSQDIFVSAAPGDVHHFPARVVADLFYLDGWEVHFPGMNIPESDLLQFIETRAFKLVAFSLTLPPAPEFFNFLRKLKKHSEAPKIIVGGQAAGALAGIPEIDLISSDPRKVLNEARKLIGVGGLEAGFDQWRVELGRRIAQLRKDRRISQQVLANAAEIDRTYLSTLENGKQNPTFSVLYRIATAIGVSLPQLINKS